MKSLDQLIKYLPKNENDVESIEKLKVLDKNDLILLIPNLLTFISDFNWPVAKGISDILIPLGEHLIPHIKKILVESEDVYLKYYCLDEIVKELDENEIKKLKTEIIRIRDNPNILEKGELVDIIAREITEYFIS